MFGEGMQQLRLHIRNKRVNEGLEVIPKDLFTKKPKFQEMSDEERQSMMERRKRNKEAAERSRKKKKVEFEKLQNENDQLNQDKCELVAMVHKLKSDIDQVNSENEALRTNSEQLKRWIGKKCDEFGLTKYSQCDAQNMGIPTVGDFPVSLLSTGGDPLLKKPDNSIVSDKKAADVISTSTSTKRRDSPPPVAPQHASRPQLQTPWLVEPLVKENPVQERRNNGSPVMLASSLAQLPENQPVVVANGQQVVYLPMDAKIIVFQNNQRAMLAGSSEPSHQVMMGVEPPELHSTELPKMSNSNLASLAGNMGKDLPVFGRGDKTSETDKVDATLGMDQATTTAIESLLKLGYKIGPPKVAPSETAAQPAPHAVATDHSYEAPAVFTVPMNATDSVADITVTTTSTTNEPIRNRATHNPQNCMLELKLKDASYPVRAY